MKVDDEVPTLHRLSLKLLIPLAVVTALLIVANMMSSPTQEPSSASEPTTGLRIPAVETASELVSPWAKPAKDANELAAGIASEVLEFGKKASDSMSPQGF